MTPAKVGDRFDSLTPEQVASLPVGTVMRWDAAAFGVPERCTRTEAGTWQSDRGPTYGDTDGLAPDNVIERVGVKS